MNTHFLALAVSSILVLGLLFTLAFTSLTVGALEWLFGRPRLTFLRSTLGENGLAFRFSWNSAKEEAKINLIRIRLFNPFGVPSQLEVSKEFEAHDSTFVMDLDLGMGLRKILESCNTQNATLQVELSSQSNGVSFQYDMKAASFLKKRESAQKTVSDFEKKKEAKEEVVQSMDFGLKPRSFIADTVPGKGPQLKIATNPNFAQDFQATGNPAAGGGEAAASNVPNFSVSKVWIAPGCIVCNACENIYPEVFHVTADTCIIRPNAPLDDGLKIKEAAEACPVEVIKFNPS